MKKILLILISFFCLTNLLFANEENKDYGKVTKNVFDKTGFDIKSLFNQNNIQNIVIKVGPWNMNTPPYGSFPNKTKKEKIEGNLTVHVLIDYINDLTGIIQLSNFKNDEDSTIAFDFYGISAKGPDLHTLISGELIKDAKISTYLIKPDNIVTVITYFSYKNCVCNFKFCKKNNAVLGKDDIKNIDSLTKTIKTVIDISAK